MFDETQCLARSPLLCDIRVINGQAQALLGIIDLQTCLDSVVKSSPEILSNLLIYDYAVYTTDYTEPGCPLVGHGMFSWLKLAGESQKTPGYQPTLIVGRVCSNVLAMLSGGSRETLEVNLRLKPTSNFTQAQYLKSIQLYKSLSSFLPGNFNHPAWGAFLSQNPILSNFVQGPDNRPKRSRIGDYSRDENSKRQKSSSFSNPIDGSGNNRAHNTYNFSSSSPPLTSSSIMSHIEYDSMGYSSPQAFETSKSTPPSFSIAATKTGWYDAPTSPISMTSPIEQHLPKSSEPKVTKGSNVKVIARGTRYKAQDLVTRIDSVSGEPCCENCRRENCTTWRRAKSKTEEDKEYLFCNPCGLWYKTKGTMRPSNRWSKDVGSSPPEDGNDAKPKRKRKTKSNADTGGPSIRSLLASNRLASSFQGPNTASLSKAVSSKTSPITSSASSPEDDVTLKNRPIAPMRAIKEVSGKNPASKSFKETVEGNKENQSPVSDNTSNLLMTPNPTCDSLGVSNSPTFLMANHLSESKLEAAFFSDAQQSGLSPSKLDHESFHALIRDLDFDQLPDFGSYLEPVNDSEFNKMHIPESLTGSLTGRKITIASSPPQNFYAIEENMPEIWSDPASPNQISSTST